VTLTPGQTFYKGTDLQVAPPVAAARMLAGAQVVEHSGLSLPATARLCPTQARAWAAEVLPPLATARQGLRSCST
jgi:hypothetical protein